MLMFGYSPLSSFLITWGMNSYVLYEKKPGLYGFGAPKLYLSCFLFSFISISTFLEPEKGPMGMDFGLKKLKDFGPKRWRKLKVRKIDKDFGPKRWRKLEVLKIDNTSNQCDGISFYCINWFLVLERGKWKKIFEYIFSLVIYFDSIFSITICELV